MTGARRTPAVCGIRWGDNTCELPQRHGGPHKRTYTDEHGQTRARTWLNRWSAA